MSAELLSIEADNFKSFKGKLVIGPLPKFTAVIGPNGSGKSNFMDAVSFVMGEKTQVLRVKRLKQLIHGANIGRPVSKSVSVTAHFRLPDGSEKKFQRSVTGSSSEYKINGHNVSSSDYQAQLQELGINVKAKNFLIYQGAVQNIAMKNPKERTALFEEISGSAALKEEYDKCRALMLKAEEETQYLYQKKKGIAAEKKRARVEKEQADKYAGLKVDYANKQQELQLFRLYHNEKDLQHLDATYKDVKREKEKADEILKNKKSDRGKVSRELAMAEQDIRVAEVEISKKRPMFIKAKERVDRMQKKLDGAVKTLEQAKKANDAHQDDIRKLELELAAVEKKQAEYEATIAGESQSQGRDVQLEEAQVHQYERLKYEARMSSAQYIQQLESVNREQKADQDKLDNCIRKKSEIENKLTQRGIEKDEDQKRIEKLQEHIRTSEQALDEQKRLRDELQKEVGSSMGRMQLLQRELDNIVEQLGVARTDKHEDSRRKNKQEILETLKREVPGVYDRMINMCHPVHKRYNVTVTKVLGKYMDAIVVDYEKTSRMCIQILKNRMLEPETFLPLDCIQAQPLKKQLRVIKEPKNVKLLFDVLEFHPAEIEPAVLFVTNNALVCDTPEDAMKVAYDLDTSYDALALDGTFCQKSGIISGGSSDLARKAKRWDEKHMAQLKTQKEKLSEELREAMKNSHKESELNTVDSQIRGLESRLRYAKGDLDKTSKQIKTLENEIVALENEMDQLVPSLTEIEWALQNRDTKIQEIKEKMNNVEDAVFSAFCAQIGVDNIRQYEKRELRTQQQRAKKKLEFESQIDHINITLEFERSRDTLKNVLRWERTVQDDEDEFTSSKQAEGEQREELDALMTDLEEKKTEKQKKKLACDAMEKEIAKARRDVAVLAEEVLSLESKLESKRMDRHNLLKQCKMDDINIPMENGTMDDIYIPMQNGAMDDINIPMENGTMDDINIPMENGTMDDITSQEADANGEDIESSMSSNAIIYQREAHIRINYSSLSRDLTSKDSSDEVKKHADKLTKSIENLSETIGRIKAPNMKAMQNLDQLQEKSRLANEEFKNAHKRTQKASQDFYQVQKTRYDKFMICFEHVSTEIDGIYKILAKTESAQAFLVPENPEEPYLDGIKYDCVAPGKTFQPMCNLSGGEKTVAALALLFAIRSFRPAPLFILDEIDGALDNTNIGKVASYIQKQTTSLQIIVISLKDEFYSHADLLVGIYPEPDDCLVSKIVTFDLTSYRP